MSNPNDLPNLRSEYVTVPDHDLLDARTKTTHPPRILLLYGSLRERSYSRFLTLEAERILQHFGAETRVFNPHELPLPDDAPALYYTIVITQRATRPIMRSSISEFPRWAGVAALGNRTLEADIRRSVVTSAATGRASRA
jgi:hypothetical protein